jgi:hypothetical protein
MLNLRAESCWHVPSQKSKGANRAALCRATNGRLWIGGYRPGPVPMCALSTCVAARLRPPDRHIMRLRWRLISFPSDAGTIETALENVLREPHIGVIVPAGPWSTFYRASLAAAITRFLCVPKALLQWAAERLELDWHRPLADLPHQLTTLHQVCLWHDGNVPRCPSLVRS